MPRRSAGEQQEFGAGMKQVIATWVVSVQCISLTSSSSLYPTRQDGQSTYPERPNILLSQWLKGLKHAHELQVAFPARTPTGLFRLQM
jgi:hypothetical protein